jgi:predicted nucleic acid binding AN1-type Zn finger protein
MNHDHMEEKETQSIRSNPQFTPQRAHETEVAAATPSTPASAAALSEDAATDSPASLNGTPGVNASPAKKKAPRCAQCSTKVGLSGFKCKCGGLYCASHRYHDAHNCDYPHQEEERKRLAAANPVVAAAKISSF